MDMVGDWCLDVRWDDRWMDRDQAVSAAAGAGGCHAGLEAELLVVMVA